MTGSGTEEVQKSRKLKSHGNTPITNGKSSDFEHTYAAKSLSHPSIASCQNQKGDLSFEKPKRGRKRKGTNNNVEVDEASKLQRRTRYLLIKMKVEQNLLDAYSTEGWKGQSREKIKPERELQRAKKQILKCKLGLRDALHQLDLLSSDGCIDESVIAPDGSVHHDNIHCAKCKLREAYVDNDIILCDGTCNCAFHQMCIDPPLLTENIPPGDQGWFCKYCICKTEIIDAMNAHLGTSYPHDSNWQDIFKVEATLPDGGDTILNQEEWPSDDSGDDDYDPDKIEKHENSCSNNRVCSADESSNDDSDVSSSYSLVSLDDEVLDDESSKLTRTMGLESSTDFIGLGSGSGSGSDCEFVSGRRQRRSVDYRKLYDEMFGKDALANEQVSEDEDWGPTNRKRREKESDAASTLMTLCESEEISAKDTTETDRVDSNLLCNDNKRSFLRIPAEAVEKLRLVFAKNELPSRAVKEELSIQLGLDTEKVNKWFKNARYLSLKTKKGGEDTSNQNNDPSISKESESESARNKPVDGFPLTNNHSMSLNVINASVDRRTKKFRRRKNVMSPTKTAKPQENEELHLSVSANKVDDGVNLGENNLSMKMSTGHEKEMGIVVGGTSEGDNHQEAEAQMEKLCFLKTKLEKLQQLILLRTPNRKAAKMTAPSVDHSHTVFVPVAQLKEKP